MSKMLRTVSAAVTAMLIAGSAHAEADPAWYPITLEQAIDLNSFNKQGNIARMWGIFVYDEVSGSGISYRLTRYEFDCFAETMRTLMTVNYGLSGDSLEGVTRPGVAAGIPPGTVGSAMMAAICENDVDPDFPPMNDTAAYVEMARSLQIAEQDRD